jgi:predicted nucleotidyltransferase
MTLETTISTMVDRIVGQFRPSRVLLFGSQARGTAHEGSDVDLLVVMRNGTDRRCVAVEIRRALGDLPVSKDIVVATPDEIASRGQVVGTVLHTALREGRVIYEQP